MFDGHVHSAHSVDCYPPAEASCKAAIDIAVTDVTITSHIYPPQRYAPELAITSDPLRYPDSPNRSSER